MMGLGNIGRLGRLALIKGGGDIITSIFADGTDGFYFDFSKTDRLFQNVAGTTPADDAGENIARALEGSKWGGRTLAAQIAAQPELWTNPAPTVVNFGGSTGAYNTSTKTFTNSGTAVSGYPRFQFGLGLTIGGVYKVEGLLTGSISKVSPARLAGSGTANTLSYSTSTGIFSGIVAAGAAYLEFGLDPSATWTGADSVVIDAISVKEIPGNHGQQATTAARPKWQTGGLARFDGSDDYLLTTLTPSAAANTLLLKLKMGTLASRVLMGCQGTTRLYLSIGAGGELSAGVGNQSLTTILASNGDLRGQTGVAALVADGTNVTLFWNGAVVYSAAQNGAPDPVPAILIGSNSGSSFTDSDIYHALAIKKALTAAQIAAITNKWGTS